MQEVLVAIPFVASVAADSVATIGVLLLSTRLLALRTYGSKLLLVRPERYVERPFLAIAIYGNRDSITWVMLTDIERKIRRRRNLLAIKCDDDIACFNACTFSTGSC